MVALMPLITIQIVGLVYKYRRERYFAEEIQAKIEEKDDIVIFPRKSISKIKE